MLLPSTGVYPDFTSETTLEELTLSMARTILNLQKSSVSNPNTIDKINITLDEEAETVTVEFADVEAEFQDGNLFLFNYFQGTAFTQGMGSYPYNRTHLVDAFFHLALTQSKYELNRDHNPDIETRYISFTVGQGEPATNAKPVIVGVTMQDLPLEIELSGGTSNSKAKPYLI
ncbi:MAG: hypothetical protein AAFO04_29525 [Cyanobacteria bacterium J06592_8]